jgi:hypothetical protein
MKTIIKILVITFVLLIVCIGLLLVNVGAFDKVQDPSIQHDYLAKVRHYLQESKPNENRNVYFGDLHIHTSYSSDAYLMGVRTLPEDAYQFAKGEVIEHGAGYKIQISRPLDFAAVTDHSEYLGMMRLSNPEVPLQTQTLTSILESKNKLGISLDYLKTTLRIAQYYFESFVIDEAASKTAWQKIIEVAEQHNQPNVFTTFIAYEWSSQPGGNNLHRNVIYKGNAQQVPERPFSALDSVNPEDLLKTLEQQNLNGMPVIAIPHNGNLSNGKMYGKEDFNGKPMSEAYGKLRAELEPINEILQVKGASETHPILSNLDEFANFEIFESNMSAFGEVAPPKGSYARDALRTGMEMYHEEGFNPYKFGVIGSSDGHNSSSPIEEDKFHGKLPMMDGAASLRMNTALLLPDNQNRATAWGSGGLAAIWSKQNTREALFTAMKNKETYATSGPRIKLRFFASESFDGILNDGQLVDLSSEQVTQMAYEKGVPMGSDLQLSESQSPEFLVWAKKDQDGANLDRLQIVKMWIDEKGKSHEKVFNISASNKRTVDEHGKLAPVGNTVDVKEASYTNDIGVDYLQALWVDPDFNSTQQAAYYARVLEIPTPRWSTYDAKTLGIEAIEPTSIQERAISSAIWH